MTNADLYAHFQTVRKRIEDACQTAKRSSSEIELLAVSKSQKPELIAAACELGQRAFGENYTQELLEKSKQLKHLSDLRWVYIGTLQSNKIHEIVAVCNEIQTLASEKHARHVARYAEEFKKTPFPVYICVNAGNEAQKSGVLWEEVVPLADQIKRDFPQLLVKGIMAIPPADLAGQTEVPKLYRQLFELAQGVGEKKLSLGMSTDLEIAIAAGSTCVRVGSDLFGARSH